MTNISMAASKRVFVDSSFLIALFNDADQHYQRSVKHSERIDDSGWRIVLSNLIFIEVVTVLSQRRNRAVAVETGELLISDPRFEMIDVDHYLHRETWKIFKESQQKDISFVDCSVVASMNAENISELLSFDEDFNKLKKYHKFKIVD